MVASLITQVGDIQLGIDASTTPAPLPVLLRAAGPGALGTLEHGAWVLAGFSPSGPYEIATQDVMNVHRPGFRSGQDVPSTRKIEFDVLVSSTTASTLKQLVDEISAVCSPLMPEPWPHSSIGWPPLLEQELAWRSPGGTWVVYGRFRGCWVTDTRNIRQHKVRMRIRFEATDPAIYDAGATTITLGKATSTVTLPYAFPLTMPAGTPTTIIQSGTAPPRWKLTILSGAANPSIWVQTYRRQDNLSVSTHEIEFFGLGNSGSTITPTATLVAESGPRTMRLDGAATHWAERYATIGSSWFSMWPRCGLLFASTAAIPGGTTATLEYRRGFWSVL